MRKFVLSLFVLAAVVTAADQVLGRALNRMFDSPRNAAVDDLGAGARRHPQVAITGSSRARNHYAADSMERFLGKRVHNFGRGGQVSSVFQYVAAQLVLAEYVPEVWVIEADARLYRGNADADKLAELLPYVNRSPAITEALGTRSRYEHLKLRSRIYPYNSLALSLLKARLQPTSTVPRNGFRPGRGEISPGTTFESLDEAELFPPVEPVRLLYLRRLVADLRSRGIYVVAVRSPFYPADAKTRSLLAREGRELAAVFASMRVPFIDVSWERYPEFARGALYADRRHLNEQGALRFSHVIADSIAQLLSRPAPRPRLDEPCITAAGTPRASPGAVSAGRIAARASAPAAHGC
jgi:hypothetical protein